MNNYPLAWIMMGVSGSGKTTIGRLFAEKLECDFLEGDRRHPLSNIRKMLSQQPLQDEDRRSWLLNLEADIQQAIERNREIVMTCSALKASYRKQLTSLGRVQLVHIDVSEFELKRRLSNRHNHYMQPEMLPSQISIFEAISPEEDVITVDGNLPTDAIMSELIVEAIRRFPSIKKFWWDRCIE